MHISSIKIIHGLAVCCLFLAPHVAFSKPKVSEGWKYFKVSGTTIPEITQSMNKKGPYGYWAFTDWYVKWDESCRLSVTIKYTMPKLAKRNKGPANVLKKWDAMVTKLKAHERNHGKNGISAAKEIEAAKCNGGNAILKKWNKQDRLYDKKTNHGKKEGVVFK